MKISQVEVEHYRGWGEKEVWRPGERSLLIGPNNGGKTSLLRAVDLVLNPHRNAYRELPAEHDFHDLDATNPFRITVVLDGLSDEDADVFEEYLEGQRPDGTFGGFDSPEEEFDEGALVLRLVLEAHVGAPARATFARPDANGPRVSQDHKLRIGWHLVPAGIDPLRELAFYQGSVFSKLFERVDLSAELDQLRQGIEDARQGLMANPHVDSTRRNLEDAAKRLHLAEGDDPLDFQVLSMSDRRVLQSLELVLRGRQKRHHLPLPSHGGGALRTLLLAAVLQQARLHEGNLILAVEEPEQNLEPINQRLVARRMLLAPESGAAQVLLTTHSPAVVSTAPLENLHLVRHIGGRARIRSLRELEQPEHKLFERLARGPITDGLYADAVLLVEGPSESGGLPEFWVKAFPDEAMDERRIEIVPCDGLSVMRTLARFFAGAAIRVAGLCDCDPGSEDDRAAVLEDGAELLVHWQVHTDWEGVLAAEADVTRTADVLDEALADLGGWERWEHQIRDMLRDVLADPGHLGGANTIAAAVAGYAGEQQQREALALVLRGKSPSFKTARDHRRIAAALESTPPTIKNALDLIHRFASANPFTRATAEGERGV